MSDETGVLPLSVTIGIPAALFPLDDEAIQAFADLARRAAMAKLTDFRDGPRPSIERIR